MHGQGILLSPFFYCTTFVANFPVFFSFAAIFFGYIVPGTLPPLLSPAQWPDTKSRQFAKSAPADN
jgi:heme A synthase